MPFDLYCHCGRTHLRMSGPPIASVECCCTSCQTAGARMQRLDGAPAVLTDHGTTPFVMVRKDRIDFVAGDEHLREFRLTPASKTRRVIATCCNTPLFLDFAQGHWLSLYAGLWPDAARPPLEMRTMAADVPPGVTLPDDVPNLRKHNLRFFARLFGAWAAMRFRSPKIPETGALNV